MQIRREGKRRETREDTHDEDPVCALEAFSAEELAEVAAALTFDYNHNKGLVNQRRTTADWELKQGLTKPSSMVPTSILGRSARASSEWPTSSKASVPSLPVDIVSVRVSKHARTQ
jgi:hypothetical protein